MAGKEKLLAGKRVVVTRAVEQAGELVRALEENGAEVLLIPSVTFAEAEDRHELDAAILALFRFDWLLLTSQNAVRFFAARCRELGIDVALLAGAPPSVAVVGVATADAARKAGLAVKFVASRNAGEGLARELSDQVLGKRILLPRSDLAAADLPSALSRAGAQVTSVVAYRTIAALAPASKALEKFRQGGADVVSFASPSAFHSFVDRIGADYLRRLSDRTVIAAIGPVTAQAIEQAGFHVEIIARDATVEGLLAAIISWYSDHASSGAITS